MAPPGGVDSPKNRAATPAILIALHSAFLPLTYRKMCGETMLKRSKPIVPFVPRHRLLGCLLRSGNRLNHHHLPHHAALHRCPLTSELVQFGLVSVQRVHFLAYDQRVLRAFLYAVSGALSRALALFHVVSATHGVADSSG